MMNNKLTKLFNRLYAKRGQFTDDAPNAMEPQFIEKLRSFTQSQTRQDSHTQVASADFSQSSTTMNTDTEPRADDHQYSPTLYNSQASSVATDLKFTSQGEVHHQATQNHLAQIAKKSSDPRVRQWLDDIQSNKQTIFNPLNSEQFLEEIYQFTDWDKGTTLSSTSLKKDYGELSGEQHIKRKLGDNYKYQQGNNVLTHATGNENIILGAFTLKRFAGNTTHANDTSKTNGTFIEETHGHVNNELDGSYTSSLKGNKTVSIGGDKNTELAGSDSKNIEGAASYTHSSSVNLKIKSSHTTNVSGSIATKSPSDTNQHEFQINDVVTQTNENTTKISESSNVIENIDTALRNSGSTVIIEDTTVEKKTMLMENHQMHLSSTAMELQGWGIGMVGGLAAGAWGDLALTSIGAGGMSDFGGLGPTMLGSAGLIKIDGNPVKVNGQNLSVIGGSGAVSGGGSGGGSASTVGAASSKGAGAFAAGGLGAVAGVAGVGAALAPIVGEGWSPDGLKDSQVINYLDADKFAEEYEKAKEENPFEEPELLEEMPEQPENSDPNNDFAFLNESTPMNVGQTGKSTEQSSDDDNKKIKQAAAIVGLGLLGSLLYKTSKEDKNHTNHSTAYTAGTIGGLAATGAASSLGGGFGGTGRGIGSGGLGSRGGLGNGLPNDSSKGIIKPNTNKGKFTEGGNPNETSDDNNDALMPEIANNREGIIDKYDGSSEESFEFENTNNSLHQTKAPLIDELEKSDLVAAEYDEYYNELAAEYDEFHNKKMSAAEYDEQNSSNKIQDNLEEQQLTEDLSKTMPRVSSDIARNISAQNAAAASSSKAAGASASSTSEVINPEETKVSESEESQDTENADITKEKHTKIIETIDDNGLITENEIDLDKLEAENQKATIKPSIKKDHIE